MHVDAELSEIMQTIADKGLRLLQKFQNSKLKTPFILEKILDFSHDLHPLMAALGDNPEPLIELQLNYWKKALTLLHHQLEDWLEGKILPVQDKRFHHKAWLVNPFYNLVCQQYLLAKDHFDHILAALKYEDKKSAQRIQFLVRQYLDALSPDNFLYSNPELLIETLESKGKNLLRGLNNFFNDLEQSSTEFSIQMTDKKAFKLGVNIACTPGEVIFQNELMELIQYTPQTNSVYEIPLLIIPPWINKYYILDLSPQNSLVRWLVSQGITVFIISWVNPNKKHAEKGLYEYLSEGPLTAVKVIQKQLGVLKVNALGFCIGGTLLAILLAYQKAIQENFIQSATFLAAMIDFSDPGDISVFIDEPQIEKLEQRMKEHGYLDGHFMSSAFNALRASDLIWSFFIKNYLQGKNPAPFDILFWNSDTSNMPAKMHSQYLRWMYLQNDLIKPEQISLNGVRLNIRQVDIPSFFVSTIKDHIAPWKTTFLGYQTLDGEKHFVLGGSGHIAGIINPSESTKYGFRMNEQECSNPEEWLNCSKEYDGSWWPYWFRWLTKKSGRQVSSLPLQSLPYCPIRPAPGNYVFMQAG